MNRRGLLAFLGIFFAGKQAAGAVLGGSQIEVGIWAFTLPSDWAPKPNPEGTAYFEPPDGSKGCYVKSLKFKESSFPSPVQIAAHIQKTHRHAFEQTAKGKWRVANEVKKSARLTHRSTLDMLDRVAGYRVLSEVLAYNNSAIHLTLHDYLCDDYAASVRYFLPIAESLRVR